MSYYEEYLKSSAYEVISFVDFMERKGTYLCQWCKNPYLKAINIKESIETDCAFVFVHDEKYHPDDEVFK